MDWHIPLADVDFDDDEADAVLAVLKSKWLTMGALTQQFEADFSKLTGIKHCIAVTNCTAGLHLAMAALGIGAGDEVIVPSLSFVATANAVRYVGARTVFADIGSETDLTIAPETIEKQITEKTRAIIVMHYAGYACDIEAIVMLAKEHDLFVVEDAAHAVGASLNGKSLGGWGDIGCFSFFPNKNMTTAEGGMVTTNDDELANKLRLLRSHGMTSLTWDRHQGHAWSYDVTVLGYNYRIDEIRSALGITQLRKLPKNNEKRRKLTEEYWSRLEELAPTVILPFRDHAGSPAYHIMPIILPEGINRARVMDKLKENGIQTSIHYPPIHLFSYYQRDNGNFKLGITELVARREVTLPLYPGMNIEDISYIAKSLADAIR
jgi:dTDP-4-amino-4,6-dideoxygalactose transaminase